VSSAPFRFCPSCADELALATWLRSRGIEPRGLDLQDMKRE
jgi:hypothetical protein